MRIEAKQSGNDFEVNFFKLMNNYMFGKTLDKMRNMVDIGLISSDKAAQKLTAKPNNDRCTIFDENLIAVHMKTIKLYFNKLAYLGMRILDLSKYGDKAKLLFTDTDSLAYEIKTKDFYKDINPDIEKRFLTSY